MGKAALRQIVNGMMDAFAAHGRPVTCARVNPDGSFLLLTEAPAGALPTANDDGDWVDLAGETEIPRA